MAACVDLNSDLGESFGHYRIGNDEKVLDFVTSANIACGYHAGDHNVMHRTVKMAVEKGVGLGAHPGLPDLIGFGRRPMEVSPEDVYNFTIYQVGALQAFARLYGQRLQHVKPHGALFNMASKDPVIAKAIVQAVYDLDKELILFGLAGSELVKAGQEAGLQVAQEVFADRTYQPDGTLTSRTQLNAMIHEPEEAIARVIRMVTEGKVTAVDGTDLDIQADTICVHGDEPQALVFVQRLRHVLQKNGIDVKKVGDR
ncbi:LamB/YcsF family protein [Microaerobacter geothermalis]|uniref:LamB/YcsF family protein n=1 Tax=Microaerobacter geothermalis TaxID=674972 RepID=UPI001F19D4AB|nr:5-oxoprolinase subunit PxpA [Microaerobacter geothermalis]MCF6095064.1 LamB/YcsF family protein [Microaerobacter geothermalis]